MKVYNNILDTIGNTPLVRLNRLTQGVKATVLAKVETTNPGNSVKDRMAVKMIEDAEQAGLIKPGGTVIEGTSGNTGMGLALACIVKGYKLICVLNDKQSKEKMDILRAVGAEVVVCPTAVEPNDPRSYYSVSRRLAQEIPNSWYVNQYDNLSNRQAHYESTGPEIWEQTEGKITHFVVGVGTGGTISGVAKYLKEKNPAIQIIGAQPKDGAKIPGIRKWPFEYLPKIFDAKKVDQIIEVSEKDAKIMAQRLAKEEGVFGGMSSGGAVAVALKLIEQIDKGVVVAIICDRGDKYLSTDLFE